MFVCLAAGFAMIAAAQQGRPQNVPNAPPAQRQANFPTQTNTFRAQPAPQSADIPTSNGSLALKQPVCGITQLKKCLLDLASDEKGVFTSPFRLQGKDATWLMPLGAATGLAIAYDSEASKTLGVARNRANTADNIGKFGSYYVTGAGGVGAYFLGLAAKDPHLSETGRLGVESILASGSVVLVLKAATNRQRPLKGNGEGDFWADGAGWLLDSSFPSDHATSSMALARVVAGEYPRWYVVIPAYGFAESIGISRIIGQQHFPSDVLVGQAIGFLTGSYVLHHHAQHCCGRENALSRVMSTLDPIADQQTRAVGISMQIPFKL
jgi:membrane-associated phospholipid phosphatase